MTVIVCPKCSRRHRVDTSKITQNRRQLVRCKVCDHRFPIHVAQKMAAEPAQPEAIEKRRNARKIAVSLSKGGVGKTTTSVNLSAGLALAGYKVLLVDTDTQGQSSFMLGKKPQAGLTELLTGELTAEEAIVSARTNLSILGGGRSLAGVKRIIDKKSFGSEWTLTEAMEGLDNKFDFIIIDTSPGWDQLTVNVLFYATEVLTPVALEVMSLHGLAEFTKNLHAIQKYKPINLNYVLPTFLDTRIDQPQNINRKLKSLYGDKVCQPIRYDEQLTRAPAHGKTIFEFVPDGNGAADYEALVRTIVKDNTIFGAMPTKGGTVIPSL